MLEAILEKYKKNIYGIIQVGAHIGQQVETFLELKNVDIHLFEPQKEPLEDLKKFKSHSNIFIHEFGLGNTNDKLTLYISDKKKGVSSSILKPKLHSKYFPEVNFNNHEEVEIKKFSDLENINGNFLMLDVQGYELEVLKGFENKIFNLDFIYSEISIKEFYEENTLVKDLDLFMSSRGFIRAKTFLYSNVPMGDALYLNNKNLTKLNILYYNLKSKFQITKLYRFLNFFRNRKKAIFSMKKYLKKLLSIFNKF